MFLDFKFDVFLSAMTANAVNKYLLANTATNKLRSVRCIVHGEHVDGIKTMSRLRLNYRSALGMFIDHFKPAGFCRPRVFFIILLPVFAGQAPATVAGTLEILSPIYSHYPPATVAGFNPFVSNRSIPVCVQR